MLFVSHFSQKMLILLTACSFKIPIFSCQTGAILLFGQCGDWKVKILEQGKSPMTSHKKAFMPKKNAVVTIKTNGLPETLVKWGLI